MNSPLKLKDADGKDVDLAIVGDTITFSSTIFVTGPGACDVAANANESFAAFSKAALQNRAKAKGNNFVMSDHVDNANAHDTKNAVKTFGSGKTVYTKQN